MDFVLVEDVAPQMSTASLPHHSDRIPSSGTADSIDQHIRRLTEVKAGLDHYVPGQDQSPKQDGQQRGVGREYARSSLTGAEDRQIPQSDIPYRSLPGVPLGHPHDSTTGRERAAPPGPYNFPPPPPPPKGPLPAMGMMDYARNAPQLPPPPPPPAGLSSGFVDIPFYPEDEVSTPSSLLPVRYSSDALPDVSSHMVRITPSRRNVFVTQHQAYAADLEEYRWLLEYGTTELWYEKPTRAHLRSLRNLEINKCGPDELIPLYNARPVSLETPRIWASAAVVTPTDDDIYKCSANHSAHDDNNGICYRCTEEKAEALENTPLVYFIVLSTCQAGEPFIHGAHFNGRQIYKLVRCGSREAAISEAFYAAGVNGWNVAFSCALRVGHDFEDQAFPLKRVESLWMLAEQEQEQKAVKVFY